MDLVNGGSIDGRAAGNLAGRRSKPPSIVDRSLAAVGGTSPRAETPHHSSRSLRALFRRIGKWLDHPAGNSAAHDRHLCASAIASVSNRHPALYCLDRQELVSLIGAEKLQIFSDGMWLAQSRRTDVNFVRRMARELCA